MNEIIEKITKHIDTFIKEDVGVLNILKNTGKVNSKEYDIISSRINNKMQHMNETYGVNKEVTDKLYDYIIGYPDDKENCLEDVLNLLTQELGKMDKHDVDMIYTRIMFIR